MDGWNFTRTPDGWEWQRHEKTGQITKRSRGVFLTLLECITDATANGYAIPAAYPAAPAYRPSHHSRLRAGDGGPQAADPPQPQRTGRRP